MKGKHPTCWEAEITDQCLYETAIKQKDGLCLKGKSCTVHSHFSFFMLAFLCHITVLRREETFQACSRKEITKLAQVSASPGFAGTRKKQILLPISMLRDVFTHLAVAAAQD